MGASTIDSLRQVIPTLKGTERSKTYLKLSQLLSSGDDAQAAIDCLDEWIAYEQDEGNIEEEGKARWSKIAVLTNCALDSLLLEEAPVQMEWFKKHRQWNHYYDTWDSKACVYMYSSRIQTALREAQDMLADAQKNGDNFGKAAAYQLMGVVYENMGQYDEAVKVFRKCIMQLKDSENQNETVTSVYDYLCQTLDESHHYQEELDVATEWEKSILRRMQRKGAFPEMHYPTYIACRCNKASALAGLGRLEEAVREIRLAEQLQEVCGTPLGQYRIYYVRVHYAFAARQPEQILLYCDSLEALNLNAGGDVSAFRGEAYMLMGNSEEAAKTFRELYYQKDSVFNREMRIRLDELNTLYRLDELKMHGQLDRSRFLIGMAVVLLVTLLLTMYLRHKAASKLRQEHELLKIANARAEESSKMKTNFIQQISHEIRTPLNVLSGFTQIVTAPNVKLDEATKKDIHTRIIESTDRITGLVNKMLELSDANSTAVIESHDDAPIQQIVLQAIEDARMSQARHIGFDMKLSPDAETAVLHTNMVQATRALALLLDNARKFTKQGKVCLLVEKGNGMARFVVEDTGIGVPEAEAEHIFEEFVQLDAYYEGTGIGLTVARSIARRLGGDVVLDTNYKEGARFVMTLPF
jgi:signal transduction histidine kinase